MTDEPGKGMVLVADTPSLKIVCPIQGRKDVVLTMSQKDGVFQIMKIMKRIHTTYKNKKIDHIFFEGMTLVSKNKKTTTYRIVTGS